MDFVCFIATVLVALFSSTARANGPFVPDPEGLVSFKTVSLKSTAPGKDGVTTTCDPDYREAVESGFSAVWMECVAIGRADPSECQRGLFDSCTKSANEMRARQGGTCLVMANAAKTIGGPGAEALSQNTSETKNSVMNKEASAATLRVADRVDQDAAAIATSVGGAGAQLKAGLCAVSSSSAEYAKAQAKINEAFTKTQTALKAIAAAKRTQAKGYETASAASNTNVAAMQSVSTSTTVANATGSAAPTANPSLGGGSSGGGSSSAQKALPLLGAAIPAAVLTGVALNGGSLGGTSASDPVPGNHAMISNNVTLTGTLTDKERTVVALAMEKLPACHRSKLNGVKVGKADLNPGGVSKGNSCVAGLYSKRGGSTSVGLDPRCGGLSVSTVIHEFYHVVGHENGQALHNAYKKPYAAHPNCPVSNYGATNFFEDFAEAGRIGSVPDNDRRSGACASSKVSELDGIMKSCK